MKRKEKISLQEVLQVVEIFKKEHIQMKGTIRKLETRIYNLENITINTKINNEV